MLSMERLCRRSVRLIHTPIRVYGPAGELRENYVDNGEQQDIFDRDGAFLAQLLALRQADSPALHLEAGEIVYGVIADGEQTYILGPCCLGRDPAAAARTLMRRHGMDMKKPYRVARTGLEQFCDVLLLLFEGLAGQSVAMVVACNILKGIGFGCAAATMFGVLQDCITYGQWLTGVQAAGMGNAASSFCMKVGSGIGTAALGWILGAGGFDADPTSASAITAINVACIWVPVITSVIAMVCLFFLNLDKHYEKAMADLSAGKWKDGTL